MSLARLATLPIAVALGLGLAAVAGPSRAQDIIAETQRLGQACNDGRGDAHACVDYGYQLYTAIGADKDHVTALRLFQSACEQGLPKGCLNAGIALRWSDVIPHAYPQALRYFERGCESSSGAACQNVGYMYRTGIGAPANAQKALQAFNRGCFSNNGDACEQEGRMWFFGQGITKNEGLAYGSFLTGCALDDMGACAMKGHMNYLGLGGLPPNAEIGVTEWQRACDAGTAFACDNLDMIREAGPETFGHAELSVRDAAERAIPRDLLHVERLLLAGYAFGDGNIPVALAAFKALAEDGMGEAAFTLGQIYYNGQGVPQDRSKAIRYFDQAAKDGHPFASFLMAQFRWSGDTVNRDEAQAVVLMRAAGAGGITEADPIWRAWEAELHARDSARQARLDQRFAETVEQARQNRESPRQADAANMARIWSLYAERRAQADEGQVCTTIYSGGRANYECMTRERFDRYYNPAY